METAFEHRYAKFGPFCADRERRTIDREGEAVRLPGKAFQLLVVLLEKPGEVVSRGEIRERLWPQESDIDYESNLNTLMNKLRTALGETLDKPLYIETVLGEGYRWLVPVEFSVESHLRSAGPLPSSVAQAEKKPRNNSALWITVGLIVLTLTAIAAGAEFARLWIAHSPGH